MTEAAISAPADLSADLDRIERELRDVETALARIGAALK